MLQEIDFETFEHAAIKKLLEGNDPVLDALRRQHANMLIKEREFTAVGFFTHYCHQDITEPISLCHRFYIDDVIGIIDGTVFMLILFIDHGYISCLEGITLAGEPWPQQIHTFELEYCDGEKRDLVKLRKEWATKS